MNLVQTLTGKKFGAIGPPGIPSFGGNWPNGLGAGPEFYSIGSIASFVRKSNWN